MRRAAEHYKRFGFEISYHDDSYAFAQRQDLTFISTSLTRQHPAMRCSTCTSITPIGSRQSGEQRALT
jgi:hypothetical protein